MPRGLGNRIVRALLESPFHTLVGDRLAVIHVVGRMSGKAYATPVNVDRVENGWVITSLRARTWWRNLRGGRLAELRVGGKSFAVQGTTVEEPGEVAQELADFFGRHPNDARYFGVKIGTGGRPDRDSLERVAAERVVIRLREVSRA